MTDYERELRRAHRVGDVDRLFQLAYPMFCRLAKDYYLPDGDRQDVIQEARIGAADAIAAWRPDGGAPLSTFLEFFARRRVQTAIKGALRHRQQVLTGSRRFTDRAGTGRHGEDLPLGDVIAAPTGDPAETVEHRGRLAALLAALPNLTDLERDAVVGIALRGETYIEIAARRGAAPKSIDNAAQRARRKLSQEIAA